MSILPIKRSKDNLIKQLAKCITHCLHIGTVCTQGVKGSSLHYVVLLLLGYLGLAHIPYVTAILLFWNQKEALVLTWLLFLLKMLTLLSKTAFSVISTPSLQTNEVLKLPGNTEDNILSFPDLKGFVFLPLPTPRRRTRLVFVNKNNRHHEQSRPKQQGHFYICTTLSNKKPE